MSIKDIHGKGEEINQTLKEGFEKLGNDVLQTKCEVEDVDDRVIENTEKIIDKVKQESSKNIMLHVRGVKNV